MFGKLNSTEIEKLIHEQFIGRLGCHSDGLTYIVPFSYAYDGNYIYCHSFEGMKVDIMRKNPKVCFQVDNTKNLANWQSVICWGTFEEIPAGEERNNALRKLEERRLPVVTSETMHLTSQWPFPSEDIEKVKGIVFRILLDKKTGRFEKSLEEYFFAT